MLRTKKGARIVFLENFTYNALMNLTKKIEQKLTETFYPSVLNISDQSHLHIGHSGNDSNGIESHFKIEIVSSAFESYSSFERHRWMNQVLSEEIKLLHAITFKIYTNEEYDTIMQE